MAGTFWQRAGLSQGLGGSHLERLRRQSVAPLIVHIKDLAGGSKSLVVAGTKRP